MSSTVNPALITAPVSTPPAGGLFSTGLMTAILGGTVPSVVDGALNPTQQTPGPMADTTTQVTASSGGSSSAAVGATQGAAADAVGATQGAAADANDKSSSPAITSAAPTRRMVTRANTEITLSASDTPSSVMPATKSPAKPKRPRGAAATAALAEAQLSSAALEEIDHVRDGLQGLATRVGDIQNRFEASMHDASVQLGDMQDSIDSLNALKTEHKLVVDVLNNRLAPVINQASASVDALVARATALEDFQASALPRLAQLAEVYDAFPAVLARIAALEQAEEEERPTKRQRIEATPATAAPAFVLPAQITTAPASAVQTTPLPFAYQHGTQPGVAPLSMGPGAFLSPQGQGAADPTVLVPQGVPHFGGAAQGPTQYATAVPAGAQPAVFLPSTVTTKTGPRRNFYVRIGPLNTNGARPLDVIASLLRLLPNNGLFTNVVKEAHLDPSNFSYLIGTLWNMPSARGIVDAWTNTRPANYASITAELMGN